MTVTVRNIDLDLIIEICQEIITWKQHALSSRAWSEFQVNWLPLLLEQLRLNEFTWNDRNKNTAVWLIDQICHSRKFCQGIQNRDCIPLADTDLGARTLEILRHMSQGQAAYDAYCQGRQFNKLFQ